MEFIYFVYENMSVNPILSRLNLEKQTYWFI